MGAGSPVRRWWSSDRPMRRGRRWWWGPRWAASLSDWRGPVCRGSISYPIFDACDRTLCMRPFVLHIFPPSNLGLFLRLNEISGWNTVTDSQSLLYPLGEAVMAAKRLRTAYAYGWSTAPMEAAVRAAFPTAVEAILEDSDDAEQWYLRRASMVFPTAEAATEVAGSGGSVAGHSLAMEYAGVPRIGPSLNSHVF